MKIIFLDIDGVLNSIDSMIAFHERRKRNFPILTRMSDEFLDLVSVGLLQRLCSETSARIVVSSTWRKLYTLGEFVAIFNEYDWPNFPIEGVTDNANTISQVRGHEIQRWLDANGNPEYIILDDDSDMLESQKSRFVHCSNVNGFRSKHYCHALRLLGNPKLQLEAQVNWQKVKCEYD